MSYRGAMVCAMIPDFLLVEEDTMIKRLKNASGKAIAKINRVKNKAFTPF